MINKKAAVFTAMGFECFGLILTFLLIGRWLDGKYETGSLWAAVGVIIGFVAWFTHLLIIIRELAKSDGSSHTDRK